MRAGGVPFAEPAPLPEGLAGGGGTIHWWMGGCFPLGASCAAPEEGGGRSEAGGSLDNWRGGYPGLMPAEMRSHRAPCPPSPSVPRAPCLCPHLKLAAICLTLPSPNVPCRPLSVPTLPTAPPAGPPGALTGRAPGTGHPPPLRSSSLRARSGLPHGHLTTNPPGWQRQQNLQSSWRRLCSRGMMSGARWPPTPCWGPCLHPRSSRAGRGPGRS